MPLFKIETRTKTPPSAAPPTAAARAPRPPTASADRSAGGLLPIIAGGSLALLILAGVGAVLMRETQPQAADPASSQPATALQNPAVPGAGAGVLPTTPPMTALANVSPVNPDFSREAVVANIAGRSFLMADLEVAVRVARTIATLSGDPVPNYGDVAEMRAFQVKLLRRQVDAILLENAARTLAGKPPPLSADELIGSLLTRQNAARQQLDDAVAANGVTVANVVAFLQRAGDIDLYVQSEIIKDLPQEQRQDAARRDALVRAWLDKAWSEQQVQIYFYDPDSVLPADERGGAAPTGQP